MLYFLYFIRRITKVLIGLPWLVCSFVVSMQQRFSRIEDSPGFKLIKLISTTEYEIYHAHKC